MGFLLDRVGRVGRVGRAKRNTKRPERSDAREISASATVVTLSAAEVVF
jgi:hypothetical protein